MYAETKYKVERTWHRRAESTVHQYNLKADVGLPVYHSVTQLWG